MSRVVYFVVGVDLDSGDKFVDDEMFVTKFGFERIWNTGTNDWEEKGWAEAAQWEEEDWDRDYVPALKILNNSDWRTE
jgi:hypothetical protein